MSRLLRGLLFLLLLPLVWQLPGLPEARAATYDPRLEWQVLETEHFRIHYHQGVEELAWKLTWMAEEIHHQLVPLIGWEPRGPTQVVILDNTDRANGFAYTNPRNTIFLYATAPDQDSILGTIEDWIWSIFVHEYTHILHIDTASGLPFAARFLAGRGLMVNGVFPGWITEGYATYQETIRSYGGRGRSTMTEMYLRQASLDGTFPRVDEGDGYGSRWPGGGIRYLFGARFHLWVAEEKGIGERGWRDLYTLHARQVIPLILPSRQLGLNLSGLWSEWRTSLAEHYRAERDRLARRGLTRAQLLGPPRSTTSAPAWEPEGELLYSQSDNWRGSRLIRLDPATGERRRVGRGTATGRLSLTPNGSQAYFTQLNTYRQYYTLSDLWRIDLDTGSRERLTRGARILSADLHPDGGSLICVVNAHARTRLARWTEEDGLELFPEPSDLRQFDAPRWSPEGDVFAAVVWKPGGFRDLHLFAPDGRDLGPIFSDRASDLDPSWTPDGSHLLFASDRDGIWNLYAWRRADGALFRLTRLVGGARAPAVSRDGAWLAYQSYDSRVAWRVARIPFDPATFEPVDPALESTALPGPVMPSGEGGKPPSPARAGLPADAVQGPRRYNPLRTLFPPRQLVPGVSLYQTGLWIASLSTGGFDTLQQHAWSAGINYRSDTRFFGWNLGWTINRWQPRISLGYSNYSVNFGQLVLRAPDPAGGGSTFDGRYRGPDEYHQRRDRGFISVSVPFRQKHAFLASYRLEFRSPLTDVAGVPFDDLPSTGSFAGLTLGWSFADTRSYRRSISSERGRALSLRLDIESTALGAWRRTADGGRSALHRGVLTGEWREYITLPWLQNHVLALRAVGGGTVGTDVGVRSFRLGGQLSQSTSLVLPSSFYPVRGYPLGLQRGDFLVLGSAEYRLPLFFVERGFWTAPLWVRSLALSVFAEAGQTFSAGDHRLGSTAANVDSFFRGFLTSAGAELLLDAVVGWGASYRVRAGFAYGFGDDGYKGGAGSWYVQLGSSF